MLAGRRDVIRISVGNARAEARCWFRRYGLFVSSDADGFAAVARQPSLARRVLNVDRRPGRHTFQLGLLLGYPPCCARAAGRAGDQGIDIAASELSERYFPGPYRLTSPGKFNLGETAISHVPCSPICAPSLRQALRALGT